MTWEAYEAGTLEHSIVVPSNDPDLHVVGRWFAESEGDFRGIAFDTAADARLVRDTLNAKLHDRIEELERQRDEARGIVMIYEDMEPGAKPFDTVAKNMVIPVRIPDERPDPPYTQVKVPVKTMLRFLGALQRGPENAAK